MEMTGSREFSADTVWKAPNEGDKSKALYALLWMPTKISLSARRVMAWLVWHANRTTGRCDPSIARLARETGLSTKSVKDALKQLQKNGLIHRHFRRGNSTAYEIKWDVLRSKFEAFESSAVANEDVIAEKDKDKRGRKPNAKGGEITYKVEGQNNSPKLIEENPRNMFRDSGHGASEGESADIKINSRIKRTTRTETDDEFGERALAVEADYAFVAMLDREVRKGRTFNNELAERIYSRLEDIVGEDEAFRGTGDPVAGRAHRLFETEIAKEEDAA